MTQVINLVDELGIIYSACEKLPSDKLKIDFVEALAELEDRECHRTHTFPKTKTHKVTGIKQAIYRAYVDKTSGWRIHFQLVNGTIHLVDIIELYFPLNCVLGAVLSRFRPFWASLSDGTHHM